MLKFWNMSRETRQKKVQVVVVAKSDVLLFEFNNQIPNNYAGFQNITGGVEGDESFEEAAARELSEEAGIQASVIDLDIEFTFTGRWKNHCIEKVFLCYLDQKPDVVLSEEHLFCKWVPFVDVQNSDYTFPTNFEAFLAAKKYVEARKL